MLRAGHRQARLRAAPAPVSQSLASSGVRAWNTRRRATSHLIGCWSTTAVLAVVILSDGIAEFAHLRGITLRPWCAWATRCTSSILGFWKALRARANTSNRTGGTGDDHAEMPEKSESRASHPEFQPAYLRAPGSMRAALADAAAPPSGLVQARAIVDGARRHGSRLTAIWTFHRHGSLLRDQDRAPSASRSVPRRRTALAYEAGAEALPL